MTFEEKMKIFRETFLIDDNIELNGDTKLSSLDNWDSMSKLSLIIIFKDYCNKKLTFEMLNSFSSIQDIFDAMD